MTEQEMMGDLAAADAAGDAQLAQHIAGKIKAARSDPYGDVRKDIAGDVTAFGTAAAQGAMANFGDEAVGGYKAIAKKLTGDPRPFGDIYKTDRDAMRDVFKQDKKEHGGASLAGGLAGATASATALPAGAFATLSKAMLSGGVLGGATALGASEDHPGMDTAIGTGVGAVTGGAGKLLMDAIPAIAAKARDVAVSQGRRVLTGGANPLAVKKPVSEEAVMEAFNQGAIRPFSTVKTADAVLERSREQVGDQYSRIVEALRSQGITGPEADALAQRFVAEGSAANANTMNPTVPKIYETAADQLRGKPTVGGRLDLKQAENLKRSLQGQAKSAYAQLQPDEVGEAHQATASMMRQAVEDAIMQQSANASPQTQAIAAQFEPIKGQLSRIIEASNAAQKGAAQYQRRAAFGLPEYIMGAGGHGPMMLGTKLLRSRGASTAAVGAKKTSDFLEMILNPQTQQQQMMSDIILRKSLPIASEVGGDLVPQ